MIKYQIKDNRIGGNKFNSSNLLYFIQVGSSSIHYLHLLIGQLRFIWPLYVATFGKGFGKSFYFHSRSLDIIGLVAGWSSPLVKLSCRGFIF